MSKIFKWWYERYTVKQTKVFCTEPASVPTEIEAVQDKCVMQVDKYFY